MAENFPSLPRANKELVEAPAPALDLEALAEKIVDLLRREIEIETERSGKPVTGN